jgi:acetyltransferase-like isoleucine patch superfamily enzyme
MDILGIELMGDNVRAKLKKCGFGVRLYPLAKIAKPEVVEIGDYSYIRDFSFMYGGHGIKIGSHTDIQPHVVIWGGGELEIGDYVSVAVGTVLLTAVYDYKGGLRMVDGLPEGQANALYGKLTIKNDVYIGANCSIMPDIIIGEGVIIGAGSFVNKNLDDYGIYAGSPVKKIGERPKLKICE